VKPNVRWRLLAIDCESAKKPEVSRMGEVVGQNAVAKAISAVRANPHGSFGEQVQHLRSLVENLPVLGHNEAALQQALNGGAIEMGVEEVLGDLKGKWVCHRASQEGAIHAEIEVADQLVIKLYMYLWSKTSEIRRIHVVRRAEGAYLYWDRGQTGALK
jgi:hypothetical protein